MKNSNYLNFDSIAELVRDLDNSRTIGNRPDESERSEGRDWCDTSSYEEARECMLHGKIYDNLSTDLNKYRTNGCKTKNKNYLDVVGFMPVVPMAIQNLPQSMINRKKTINNKIVTIVYNCATPHYVKGSQIMETTTELMKNIIQLEQDGYRVNLYVSEYNDDGSGFGFVVKLKTDRETLNIKKMCFPLVSSSFLRRIGFRIKERLYKDWVGGGYGCASFNENGMKKLINKTLRLQHYECWNYEGKKFSV